MILLKTLHNGKKFYAPLLVAASRQDKAMAELLLAYGVEEGRDSAMVKALLDS